MVRSMAASRSPRKLAERFPQSASGTPWPRVQPRSTAPGDEDGPAGLEGDGAGAGVGRGSGSTGEAPFAHEKDARAASEAAREQATVRSLRTIGSGAGSPT